MAVAAWLLFFGGWSSVQGWFGQQSYTDQRLALETFVKGKRVGSSPDVWLVKGNAGVIDRVALFFGYMDDWGACYEFMLAHQRDFPADRYSCQFAE